MVEVSPEVFNKWIEIAKTGGLLFFLLMSWVYFIWMFKRNESEKDRMRLAYTKIIGEKDDLIEVKDGKIENMQIRIETILENQVKLISDNLEPMTSAMVGVEKTEETIANLLPEIKVALLARRR